MNALSVISTPEPANVETEAALLGCLMSSNASIDAVADSLTAEDFYEPIHGMIFSAIVRERSLGRAANPVTLRPYFENDPAFLSVGGAGYLSQLTGSGAALVGARDFAEQVSELSRRRKLIEGLREAIATAQDWSTPLEEVVGQAETAVSDAAADDTSAEDLSGAECIRKMLDGISEDRVPGVTSGLTALDTVLGPLRPKSQNILAARPGMGKTATAISYALGAAFKGHGVLFISLEVSAEDIAERMASDLCFQGQVQVPFGAITSGKLSNEQARQVARAAESIEDLPLRVVDISAPPIGRLSTIVRRHKRRFAARGQKLELVIVDYLQLVRPDRKGSNRTEDVGEISMGMKQIAKANGVAVLALAQLSRKVEDRTDKRPMLSDLRESGQIEQDADAICFLFSAEYYLRQSEPQESDPARNEWEGLLRDVEGDLEFIVAKRRRGPAGIGRGKFYRAFQAVRG